MENLNLKNRCIEVEYCDVDGVLTDRKINLQRAVPAPSGDFWYLKGFCHLRRSRRSFRSDRIRRIRDGANGWQPVANPAAWLESLLDEARAEAGTQAETQTPARPAPRPRPSPAPAPASVAPNASAEALARQVVAEHFHGLRVLIYVAKADKRFRAAEKRLLLMFFKRIAHYRFVSAEMEALAETFALEIDPPRTGQFYHSVGKVAERGRRYRMAICATAKAMINSDNLVKEYELHVLDYLVRRLRPQED